MRDVPCRVRGVPGGWKAGAVPSLLPGLAVAAAAAVLAVRANGPPSGPPLALFSFAVSAFRGRL